ncbi:primosomal protein N' [Nocardia sp. CDC160]|uniref:primosomal protein N' n=1 Tax=Nocardia sp. CDC160 TaxID=3112166 RepID=UPI002DBBF2AD|nr:primosomal protein N' [Nocardia sp. CDC160]MEC3918123.1 primosomal protein N' [Nocardia sp. CDC160]
MDHLLDVAAPRPASTTMTHPIARVLPLLEPAHLDRDFDYLVPPEMDEIAQPGVRVRVRFSGRLVDGYLLERLEKSDHTGKLVRLERVVSPERVLTPEILKLVGAVASRYAGTRADVLRLAIPPRHAKVESEGTDQPEKPKRSSKKAKAVAAEVGEEITRVDPVVESLSAQDVPVSADVVDEAPEPAAAQPIPEEFPAWGRYVHGHSFLGALAAGRGPRAGWQALPGEEWARRLAELAAVTVRGGRSAVIMVPDQRDLDRVLAECVALVGESAVGLAAGLGPSARYRRWLSVLRGTARVVVGTRSAVFAPVKELGLIAIWDDGDDTFAEPRAPYPHAREVAMLRAHETGAAFVAGGFSRTAEVQAIVESGWAHDLLADRSVVRQAMPRITAPGDTDAALERDPIAQAIRIPAVAFTEARKALKAGGPVLVQVPRRGYIPALSCAKCRTPARCRHCNGPLALPDSAPASRGALRSGRDGVAEAQSPACRWCGITEAAFRCGACGSRALRAVVIGASRTAEELGRAFPGVPVRGSGGSSILNSVPEGPQVVVSTIGAEPPVPGGYAVAMLLDGWALLGRADLRAAEDALRRWMSAAALVRPDGRVIVMADAGLPTVQALVRWDPVWHAGFELEQRAEVRFPPAVRFAAIDGTTESIAELLGEAKLPDDVEILGPVPLPPGARKPFSSGDSPAEVERMILRADRSSGAALSRALTAAQAVRSTHRSDAPLRVQIDPIDIG